MSEYLAILGIISKYPFIRATGKFLEREFKKPEDMFSKKYKNAVQLAVKAVKCAAKGEKFDFKFDGFEGLELPVTLLCFSCDRECVECKYLKLLDFYNCNACCECYESCYQESKDYTSLKVKAKMSAIYYVTSKAIISELSGWIRRKFAIEEASRYAKMLEGENNQVLLYIASDLKMKIKTENSRFLIHVTSYLKSATKIRDEKRRLVNRKLLGGWVEVDRLELVRLVEEVLREKISQSDFKDFSTLLPSYVKNEIANIESLNFKTKIKLPVRLDCLPPCMKKILSDLQKGVNIPHTARFAITAFLLNIGMNVDEIVELFSTAPDFNEEVTRYQVEHIAGQRGKGSEYICPSCETMKTYNNCVADCKVLSPLSYYSKKVKRKKSKKDKNKK